MLYLVLMARSLAVLGEGLESLVDKRDVGLVDVESEQTESTSRTATDTVEKLQRLTDNVVVCLVRLRPQIVLNNTFKGQ